MIYWPALDLVVRFVHWRDVRRTLRPMSARDLHWWRDDGPLERLFDWFRW